MSERIIMVKVECSVIVPASWDEETVCREIEKAVTAEVKSENPKVKIRQIGVTFDAWIA